MIRVNQIRLEIHEEMDQLKHKIAKKLRVKPSDILGYSIYRESIDARKKDKLYFVYTVDVMVKNEKRLLNKFSQTPDLNYIEQESGKKALGNRPVIVGMGPAGLFAGLILAKQGYNPLILERGQDVDARTKDIEAFWKGHDLKTESNVQFGEGGAGTFSDGKLTSRSKDLRVRKVLEAFIEAGAPKEILYAHLPHIGTDVLKGVIKTIRQDIIRLGGEVRFGAKVTDLIMDGNRVHAIEINGAERITTNEVLLAIGHSARDTYEMLYNRKVYMMPKPIAIGVRIEHAQTMIDGSQYGPFQGHPRLGAASYRLTHRSSQGRGVYTFCMCPGGTVVASSSEKNRVVTNGMSEYARDKENANSALLVQAYPEDYGSEHPLAGIEFQRQLEERAFELGGGDYRAPAQLVGDFLMGKASTGLGGVQPSYLPGVKLTNLEACLPEFVVEALREALPALDRKIKGFAQDDAVLTAVETRSSAPVKIERDPETLESVNIKGLYPIGEGAGYAGGIVSAAIDGIKAAERVIGKYRPL